MKTKFIIPALLLFVLSACDNYFVPDDFPKEAFFSYTPYQKGDTIVFASSTCDTLSYIVKDYDEIYYRGKKGIKGGKESATASVVMSRGSESIELVVTCIDRACFTISAEFSSSNSMYKYSVDYYNEDVWAKSYDETKIFKQFTDLVSLTNDKAQTAVVKKGRGLVSFYTPSGVLYELVK